MEPAALHGLFRLFRLLEVHDQGVGALAADLAGQTGLGDGGAVVFFQAGLHVQAAQTGGAEFGQGVLGLEDRVVGGQFRLAVVVVNLHARQALHHLFEDLHRHDGGPVVGLLQAGEILFGKLRMAEHADPDRGRGEEHRGLVGGDILQDLADIGHHEDVRPPHPEDGIHEDVPLGTVVDGQGVDVDVILVVLAVHDAPHIFRH